MDDNGPPDDKKVRQSTFGHFIQTYSSFLSSFVIGVAGLTATSIYQYNQSHVAQRQADSQQHIAETQADNSWKIERAKILSENLKVLTAQGGDNTEQKYGVLLSLTRGNILDSELALSYALELGKENPDYMRSVLSNTLEKDYRRLLGAYEITCEERYGLSRPVKMCEIDKKAERSVALAVLIMEETDQALQADKPGPMVLLKDEREVHAGLTKLLWIFTPFLNDLYERRQWDEIGKFEKQSVGARLVASLVLLAAHNGEFAAKAEAAMLVQKSDEERRWLVAYLLGPTCDAECKARASGYMLTALVHAMGSFNEPLHAVLTRPHNETTATVTRINTRFMLCQVTPEEAAALRNQVLVPALTEQLARPKPDLSIVDEISGLLALTPDPVPGPVGMTDPKTMDAWKAAIAMLQKAGPERYQHFQDRRVQQQRARQNPTAKMKKSTFCSAKGEGTETDVQPDEE